MLDSLKKKGKGDQSKSLQNISRDKFCVEAAIRVDRENGEKTGSSSHPGSPITPLENCVSEVTRNQWLKRHPQIFLPVRKEQCVIFSAPQHCLNSKSLPNFSSIGILPVGGPHWSCGMSVGPVVTWIKLMFHNPP